MYESGKALCKSAMLDCSLKIQLVTSNRIKTNLLPRRSLMIDWILISDELVDYRSIMKLQSHEWFRASETGRGHDPPTDQPPVVRWGGYHSAHVVPGKFQIALMTPHNPRWEVAPVWQLCTNSIVLYHYKYQRLSVHELAHHSLQLRKTSLLHELFFFWTN